MSDVTRNKLKHQSALQANTGPNTAPVIAFF